MKIGEAVVSEDELKEIVKSLADKINADYAEDEELIVVGILKGCFVFMSDLVRNLKCDVKTFFMEVSSYGDGTESSGKIVIKKDLNVDIGGKNVLIAEDIIDTGITLYQLLPILEVRKPKTLRICTLLHKPERTQREIKIDYKGKVIPDKFIVGYGLDCAERFRQLPYIAEVEFADE